MISSGSRGFSNVEFVVVIAIIFILLGVFMSPDLGFNMVFGWALFLLRVVPEVAVNWSEFGLAIIAFVGCSVLIHSFGKSISASRDEGEKTGRWGIRRSLAVTSLVALLFIAGIAAIGVVHQTIWMSQDGIFKPWEAVLRTDAANRVRQLAIASHNRHDTIELLPSGTMAENGVWCGGWISQLLPFIGQEEFEKLYEQIHRDQSWNDLENRPVYSNEIGSFLLPGDQTGTEYSDPHLARADFARNQFVVGPHDPINLEEIPDGTSNTILYGEVNRNQKPWGHPANWRDPSLGIEDALHGFGSLIELREDQAAQRMITEI